MGPLSEDEAGPDVTSDIPCENVDDCWASGPDDPAEPIARPASERGRRFRPCEDGEAAPVCAEGHCGLVYFGC